MTPFARLVIIAAALPLAACQQGERLASTPPPERARNVILFIGDGMGISTVTAARIYEGQKRGETGEENLLSFEKFPHTALIKTYNTDSQVPDSAGTATAMNAGVKTRIGFIGVGEAVESVGEFDSPDGLEMGGFGEALLEVRADGGAQLRAEPGDLPDLQ